MYSRQKQISLEDVQRRLDLTNQQVLAYSRDFARIYKQERERRVMLEELHLKLRAVVNSMSDAMVATDKKLNILEYNSSFSRLFPSFELKDKKPLTDFLPNEVIKKYVALMKRDNRESVSFEFSIDSNNSSFYWISLSRILNSFKKHSGYVFLFRDITEIRKFEKLKRNFITLASKEIQVPLNGLLGLLYLLFENIGSKLTDEERSYFSFLINSGKNLQQMLEEMMQISPMRGVDELNKSFVQLDGLVLESLDKSEGDVKSLELQIQFEVTNKGAILIDRDLLFKAIYAVITNLIAYTKEDGKIEIEQLQSGDNLLLQYRSSDISKEDWKELQGMLNAPNGFQDKIEGTGIGLALAREIVEWNGGQIHTKNGKDRQMNIIFPSWSKVVGVSSKQE